MKHLILTLGMFSLGLLTSCDNASEVDHQEEVEHHDHRNNNTNQEVELETENGEDEMISLDNGTRWTVNEEMKPFVLQGQNLVIAYSDSGDEDYKSLAENLEEQNEKLISSCTMDGESHDELHKWLHPHLKLTKELKDADDIEVANLIVDRLITSYSDYHKHFQ